MTWKLFEKRRRKTALCIMRHWRNAMITRQLPPDKKKKLKRKKNSTQYVTKWAPKTVSILIQGGKKNNFAYIYSKFRGRVVVSPWGTQWRRRPRPPPRGENGKKKRKRKRECPAERWNLQTTLRCPQDHHFAYPWLINDARCQGWSYLSSGIMYFGRSIRGSGRVDRRSLIMEMSLAIARGAPFVSAGNTRSVNCDLSRP